MGEIVRQTEIRTDDRSLTVSTVKIAANYYDTVVFDDSVDKRHVGHSVGGFVIDELNKRDPTRHDAQDTHRALFLTARDGEIIAPQD